MKLLSVAVVLFLLAPLCPAEVPANLRKENLVAWCVAHNWDTEERHPAERAALLKELGLGRLAYNWRNQDGPDFEEEILQCKKHGIEFFALWNESAEAFRLFKKHGLHPQVWKINPSPKAGSQEEKVAAAADQLLPMVKRAKEIGSPFGLYNHGNWGGEPENLVAVCQEFHRRGFENVGIVYNFHHGHGHIGRFAERLELMKPYLLCLNLNGMVEPPETKENKILPIGSGVHEAAMLQAVIASGYDGPVGILGHISTQDVEKSLRDNLKGLEKVLRGK